MKFHILKRILGELKGYRLRIIIVGITGILYALATARSLLMTRELQNTIGNVDYINHHAAIIIGFLAVAAVSRYLHIYNMNMVGEMVVNGFRLRLQRKFMHLSLGFHNKFETGSGGLLSRILYDIRVIQDGLRMVADVFSQPLLAISLLANLFYLNWQLTAKMLVVLPIILFLVRKISKGLPKFIQWGQENLERITVIIKESLDGLRTIQSFNLESSLEKKLAVESQIYLKTRKRVHKRVEVIGPMVEFIAGSLIVFIFYDFGVAVTHGRSTVGDVIAYVACMIALNPAIKKFQESYVRIQETLVAAERAYQILDEPNVVKEHPNKKPFPKDWQKIEYRNVSFSYDQEQVLKNINLKISRGEHLAFVGESGSGKSTLVNLIERFYEPTSGEILIDNININEIDLKELRKNIALVSQDVFLFSDSIENNIWMGDLEKEKNGVESVAKSANAHNFISKTTKGYHTSVGDRGNLFSGGEKQRISIARALFKDAPILVLDEATSALDSASEIEVQKGLDQLMQGRTSLVIAHRLSTVQHADRIVVLKKGEIVETGKHSDLLNSKGEYHRFFTLQTTAFIS